MSAILAEQRATWSRAIAGLLGNEWTAQPETGTVVSDRVTIDLAEYTISFRSNHEDGRTLSVQVDSSATLGTYATLGRALHGMTDDSARRELHGMVKRLGDLADALDHWDYRHNHA